MCKTIVFHKDWRPLISSLPDNSQIVFWSLFMQYEHGSDVECNDPMVVPIWTFISSQLDKMSERYEDKIVLRNRLNGQKGGRPKQNPNNPLGYLKTQPNPTEPNRTQKTLKNKNKSNNKNNDNILEEGEIELLLEVHGEVKGWQIINQLNSTDNARERFLKYHKEKIKTKHDWAKHFVEKNEIEFNGFAFKQKIPAEKLKGLLRKFISDLMQEKRNVNCLESEFLVHFKRWIKKQG